MLTEYGGTFFLKCEKALEIINETFKKNPVFYTDLKVVLGFSDI